MVEKALQNIARERQVILQLTLPLQSVRRKGGKTGKGHVYIICSLNPKHKQRQGK